MRYHVDPREVPPAVAARRMGLSEAEFNSLLPQLLRRGFPASDPTTGRFDLDAIDQWRKSRNPHLFGLTNVPTARDARALMRERMAGNG